MALVGAEEAGHLVATRPAGIVADAAPATLPPLKAPAPPARRRGLLARFLRTA